MVFPSLEEILCLFKNLLSQRGQQTPGPLAPYMRLLSAMLQGCAKGFTARPHSPGSHLREKRQAQRRAGAQLGRSPAVSQAPHSPWTIAGAGGSQHRAAVFWISDHLSVSPTPGAAAIAAGPCPASCPQVRTWLHSRDTATR